MGEAVLYCVGASPYVIPAWRPSILYIRRLCDHIWIGRLTCTCLPYVLVWNLYRGGRPVSCAGGSSVPSIERAANSSSRRMAGRQG